MVRKVVTRNTTSFERDNKRAIANTMCITVSLVRASISVALQMQFHDIAWLPLSRGSIVYSRSLFAEGLVSVTLSGPSKSHGRNMYICD